MTSLREHEPAHRELALGGMTWQVTNPRRRRLSGAKGTVLADKGAQDMMRAAPVKLLGAAFSVAAAVPLPAGAGVRDRPFSRA